MDWARCSACDMEYDRDTRKGKPGRITTCNECADEVAIRYTGNQVADHKTGSNIQINADPRLTQYIIQATKLRNKGSNLGQNLHASARMSHKTTGACIKVAESINYKGK